MEIQNFSSSGYDKTHALVDRTPAEPLLAGLRIAASHIEPHERSYGVIKALIRELENELAHAAQHAAP